MAFLRAFGAYLPSRVVDNQEMAAATGTQPQYILRASGIEQRRFAAAGETVASMGVRAAEDCLANAGLAAVDVGLLIATSSSAEQRFPGPASAIGAGLGIQGVPAIDLPIASAGSLFGMALAAHLAQAYGNVLIVAAEAMSRVVARDLAHRDTAILFGDGAGACLVGARTGFAEIRDALLASDGDYAGTLRLDLDAPLYMDGRTVILQAARKIPRAIAELLERNRLAPAAVEVFLMHQANLNLITRVAQSLGVAEDRFFCNIRQYGNTSSASMFIAAAEWRQQCAGPPAGPLVFATFGAGLHWGALLALPLLDADVDCV
ncbi:MAG TPA: ketoacyl-ACP synthase III [Bryobacteraceae bacterium]|jgi:3-oxoacyl-[acyl-carrier-protein] synthase-3|nr:ketoacyl-ACP synthase III [Bryobacteraceae bacterium]